MITAEQLDRMDADIAGLTTALRRRREQCLAELEDELETVCDMTAYEALCRRVVGLRADLFHMDVGEAIRTS